MKLKTLFVLALVAGAAFAYLSWAKPHAPKHQVIGPRVVTVKMPNPVGN